jgi:D-alanyl-D-alanine dipeptidase
MVEVAHPRIAYLAAYHRAGLPDGTELCLLRVSTAQRLYEAVGSLPEGFGLAVFDGWRHPHLQAYLAAACPDPRYVTPPEDPTTSPAPHTTGGAVDLTLTARGTALALGTSFDHFGPGAAVDAVEDRPGLIRDLRRMLHWAMVEAGFAPYSTEWWHFEYGTRRWGAHTGLEPRYGPVSPDQH